jgi:thiol-disulfide isomerase/thioredoxin
MVAVIAGLGGFLFDRARMNSAAVESAAQTLMSASLADLNGKPQMLSGWRGKTLVVNFWSTWCGPCREEIPALIKAQTKYSPKGVQLVGIGIDDVAKIKKFVAEMNMDYVLLIGGMDTLEITKGLGNSAIVLPFTVVLDRSGKVAYTHAGALTDADLDRILMQLL